jgi:hypothetical protein
MRFTLVLRTTAGLLLGTPPALAGQRTAAQLVIGAGSATDVRGITSSAVSLSPSLTTGSPAALWMIGLNGTAFDGGAWSVGAGTGLDLGATLGPKVALTFGAAANMVSTSFHSSSATLAGTPALELRLPALTLFGGVRGATARSSLRQVGTLDSPLSSTVTRSSLGPLFGGRLALGPVTGRPVMLGYREEHARVAGVSSTDRIATLSVVLGSLAMTGLIGTRQAPDEDVTFGGVRTTVALSRTMALRLSAESYPQDRLTGALGGRTVNLGLVLRTRSGAPTLPRPHGVAAPARGITRLTIRAPEAQVVEVAGEWNGWRPVPAKRGANGVWYADLDIPAGEYRYAFHIDGKEWRVPEGAVATEDGFGGRSAWLTVSRATT